MKTTEKNELRQTAIKRLKRQLKPGSTVYTIIRSVSSSGMSRKISLAIAHKSQIVSIDWEVSHALDYKRDPSNGALKVRGCGMDMGFHLVYSLGRVLFPKGFKFVKGQYGRNGDKSGFDNDGGYALKQQWL